MMKRKITLIFIFALLAVCQFPVCARTNSSDELQILELKLRDLHRQGKCNEAIPVAQRLFSLTKQSDGHLATARSLAWLGLFYHETERYAESEQAYKKSLEIQKMNFGMEDPGTAQVCLMLGMVYHKTEQYTKAEELYKQSLEIFEKLVMDDPLFTRALNELAEIYKATGRYAEAEPLFQQSLQMRENELGKGHPDVAESLYYLGGLYARVGRFAEAESLFKRSLQIQETCRGKLDPKFAKSLSDLGLLYVVTGRYAEAEPLLRQSLNIWKTKLGKEHVFVAASLNNLAWFFSETGRYTEAESLYKQALKIWETKCGKNHQEFAKSLNNLATVYIETRRFAEAKPLCQRSLEIWKTKFGENHPDVATALNNLATIFINDRHYEKAELLLKRSLEIREVKLGKDHPDVAQSLHNLAALYKDNARYTEAEPLYRRSIEIRETKLGKDHPLVADSLDNLAGLYEDNARYAEAEPLYRRSIEIRETKLGKDHPLVADSLDNLAGLYIDSTSYAEAKSLLERSIEIMETKLGKDHKDVTYSLNKLALLYGKTGRYAEAELLFKRCLRIREMKLGKDHQDVASLLNGLGMVYGISGRYAEAESLLKRSIKIRETKLGKDHRDVADPLNTLAYVYMMASRYDEAGTLFDRSIEIMEAKQGKDHPLVATSLNNLGYVYMMTGRYDEAETLFERSIEIREAKQGKDHPLVATSLNNLATIFINRHHDKAELLLKRSLEIREVKLGKDHPDVAQSLHNLANLYLATYRYAEAEPLNKRALEILETKLGKNHPDVAASLINFAGLYGAIGKFKLSHQNLYRSLTIGEQKRENVFLMLDERKKLSYIMTNRGSIEMFLSLTAHYLQKDDQAVEDAFNAWLRWKGSVAESQGRLLEAYSSSDNPAVIKKFLDLTEVRRTLAGLYASKPEKMDTETYRRTLGNYEVRKISLESDLSDLSKDFALERLVGKADFRGIAAHLPQNAVYLDFAVVTPYDFKANKFEDKPRCLVFILTTGDRPRVALEDLGYSAAIDRRVREYHNVIQEGVKRDRPPDEGTLRGSLQALFRLVMEPLMPHLQGSKQIFISPDGGLNFIPFEALITPEGRYLVDDLSINYVAAGRDILRFDNKTISQGKSLILADPDYDLGEKAQLEVVTRVGMTKLETRGATSIETQGLPPFARLTGTKIQAKVIEKVLKKQGTVKCFQNKEAIQEVLFKASRPRLLHIATHGYFIPIRQAHLLLGPREKMPPPEVIEAYENPMHRSGIALAGANTSLRQRKDYGLVNAEKIQGLNLRGTDLVVLSACETGVGDVQSGEGVFGLKRAFILSGARTVVMSLWSVPSEETTELMKSFYSLLSLGRPKSEALREAKRTMKEKNANPFFWGAFVMVGDPGR